MPFANRAPIMEVGRIFKESYHKGLIDKSLGKDQVSEP